jgi:transglutaminase-like putative cysteine protease
VHTLRCEALEAGDRAAASQAITPGVLKMTLFATAASVVLALVLFVVLPRLRSSVVTGSGIGPVTATSGFSDTVALGELGSIRLDPTVVMRVETISGDSAGTAESYWRGLAFDHFDGRSWSITPSDRNLVPGSVESGITFGWNPDELNLVQTIVREPVESGVIFAIGDRRSLRGTIHRPESDVNGGLYAAGQSHERIRYTIGTQRDEWRDATLERDLAVSPRGSGDRYYQLPELSPAVAELAREITRAMDSDAERIRALEKHLATHGRYSDTPPAFDASAGGSALENFLFEEMAAHCEYYASALVVLARSIRLPARLVNGFAGGHWNGIGDFIEVRRSDAHAWVEVHFEDAGWVRYDATPPDLRSRAGAPASFDERFRELASAMELWWFQRVVGFDRSDQIHAMKRAVIAWRDVKAETRERNGPSIFARWRGLVDGRWREGVLLTLGLLASGAILWRLRPAPRRKNLPAAYADALRLLARRGLVRHPSTTARGFSNDVCSVLPTVGVIFDEMTESYLRERFGGRPDLGSRDCLRRLREELRAA